MTQMNFLAKMYNEWVENYRYVHGNFFNNKKECFLVFLI